MTFASRLDRSDEKDKEPSMTHDRVSCIQPEQPDTSDNPDEIFMESDSYSMKMLSIVSQTFSNRCNQFQKLLVQYLQQLSSPLLSQRKVDTSSESGNSDGMSVRRNLDAASANSLTLSEIFDMAGLHRQLSELQNSCVELENQLEELAHARDEAYESERRVRRALYRLASGRLKLGEVVQVRRTTIVCKEVIPQH
jgi:hypothetical protein